ncbi:MAG: hypothetical protein LBB90_08210, partial [Tannerella sp.]|nr:hypothetical protein [Tannerella sp.]
MAKNVHTNMRGMCAQIHCPDRYFFVEVTCFVYLSSFPTSTVTPGAVAAFQDFTDTIFTQAGEQSNLFYGKIV